MEKDKSYMYMTKINKSKLRQADMSPREIIEFLNNGAIYRTFADVLAKVYPGDDLRDTLVAGLTEITGKNHSSVSRKVLNWIKGLNTPQRKNLFQICFALKLDEDRANQLLASASDTGIHYRNPVELIYGFCLRTGRTYQEAKRLEEKLMPVYDAASKQEIQSETSGIRENPAAYTCRIRDVFKESVRTEEELYDFFCEYGHMMGEFHNTAYEEFMRMLGYLRNPDKKNVKVVVEEFMQMHVPADSRRKKNEKPRDYTYLQEVIKKNWPSEDIIYKMTSRSEDVSRKVLLLLFLLTEEFEAAEPPGEWPEFGESYFDRIESDDGGERMEARLIVINLFLERFGMNRLDPGNAFDCLILYALRASYRGGEDEPMSSRLEQALELLFPEAD